jgi:hypothetical protein
MYMLMHSHSYCKPPTETLLLFLLLALQSLVDPSLCQNCPSGFQFQKLLNRTFFLWGGVVSPTHSPNLEVQGIPCCLGHPFDLSRMGGPTSSLNYHQHSSQDHMTTQAPPLQKSNNGGGGEDTLRDQI